MAQNEFEFRSRGTELKVVSVAKTGARHEIEFRLRDAGHPVVRKRVEHPLKHKPEFQRIGSLLRSAGDPDWRIFKEELGAEGVPIGVEEDLPRAPAIFEEKSRWRLEERDGLPEPQLRDNYLSTEGRQEWLRKHFVEQAEKGMIVWLSDGEAKKQYGGALTVATGEFTHI